MNQSARSPYLYRGETTIEKLTKATGMKKLNMMTREALVNAGHEKCFQ